MNEDDYFAKLDQEARAKLKAKLDAQDEARSRAERRAAHFHRCGKCGAGMDTHTFRGVDIEVCPECGAVLLDKGELETLAGHDDHGTIITGILQLFGRGDAA